MAIWTLVGGVVRVPPQHHFSVKKSADDHFECRSTFNNETSSVAFNFIGDGEVAASKLAEWVRSLPKGSYVDLNVQTRFVRG